MKNLPFPLEGGSYRVENGALVREDDAPVAPAPAAEPDSDSGDAAAATAEPIVPRRRKHTED